MPSSPRGESLTPIARADEATAAATYDGLINAFFTLLPCGGALKIAMNNPEFMKRTNNQSRTALVIMPTLFVFAWTAEHKLNHKMREMAQETQHAVDTVRWGEQQLARHNTARQKSNAPLLTDTEADRHLTELYMNSVKQSGVNIVPGTELAFHQQTANFVAENPFKVLAACAVPAYAWIFHGRTGKEHLTLGMKIMHTRVFGQFAAISTLLGIMAFKEYMDQNGRYITQVEADKRVEEMKRVRENLMRKLEHENQLQLAAQKGIADAHKQDVKEGHARKDKLKASALLHD